MKDPNVLAICEGCGKPIYKDEFYVEIEGKYAHGFGSCTSDPKRR